MITLNANAVAWQQVDDQLVLLDTRSSRYMGVNRAGAIMWPKLVEGCSADDLAAYLAHELAMSPDDVRADVESFVEDLRRRDMVIVSS